MLRGENVTADGRERGIVPPLPSDAPLLGLEDAAAYSRTTVGAIRKEIEAGVGPLAEALRANLVILSERRRFIRAEPFKGFLRRLAEGPVKPADANPARN